ncbi:MAG: hypothetical protein Q4A13_05610 [Fretibacterium sp.]|uniref:CopG family transcriptional regulator n=1 Tax=Fretibacterium sp. OH1220_COT-178 TaxID=2491047 RepID=UPI000F5FF5BC|nr:CopG family transcriptional regulator [Fretibacterium sp. OH1220_COT-178]MDO4786401.1 hypothetical protein [Fretibacterium sp.]RRD63358.1 CopG family transcriptional regulator [Fretibacterium sp. OH1220_COT-178]
MSIILNLPPELESRLDALARDADKTREDYLVDALERYLEELENYNDAARTSGLTKGDRMGTFAADAIRSDLELEDR